MVSSREAKRERGTSVSAAALFGAALLRASADREIAQTDDNIQENFPGCLDLFLVGV
jgi:hypothetical protein